MSAPTRTPRSSWIEEGLRALAAGGPDAVRIELLARALGVTRGGFYWHFDDRRALLEEILDTWERMSVDEVIERVDSEGGDARAKLRRLSALAASSDEPLRIDLAVRDWARREQTRGRAEAGPEAARGLGLSDPLICGRLLASCEAAVHAVQRGASTLPSGRPGRPEVLAAELVAVLPPPVRSTRTWGYAGIWLAGRGPAARRHLRPGTQPPYDH